jgi:predicted outer membrane lipoprotein
MNHNDNLDRILEEAMREYRDAEPLSGMEDRILRRIAASPQPSVRRWAWILAISAAAAVIVIAVWLGLSERRQQQRVAKQVTQPLNQAPTSTEGSIAPVPHPSGREAEVGWAEAKRLSVKRSKQPGESVWTKPTRRQFPTPAPLTSEEHALLALARTYPNALLARPNDAGKLSIAPIEIKPLAPEVGAPEGEQE